MERIKEILFQFEHGRKNLLNQNSVEHKAEINGLLLPDIISLEFAYDLVPLFADEIEKGFPHIIQLRKQMALQWGIIVPAIRLLDKGEMSAMEYQICVHGIPVYTDVQKESDEDSLLQIMEKYIDCDGMEPKVLAEKVCQEMPEGFAFEHWIDRRG